MSDATLVRACIYYTALSLAMCLAIRQGGRDEIGAAKAAILASVATFVLRRVSHFTWQDFDVTTFAIDSLLLGYLVIVALRTRRFWPLYAAAFTLVMWSGHILKLQHSSFTPLGYAVTSLFWSYPIVLVILIAALRSPRPSPPSPAPGAVAQGAS